MARRGGASPWCRRPRGVKVGRREGGKGAHVGHLRNRSTSTGVGEGAVSATTRETRLRPSSRQEGCDGEKGEQTTQPRQRGWVRGRGGQEGASAKRHCCSTATAQGSLLPPPGHPLTQINPSQKQKDGTTKRHTRAADGRRGQHARSPPRQGALRPTGRPVGGRDERRGRGGGQGGGSRDGGRGSLRPLVSRPAGGVWWMGRWGDLCWQREWGVRGIRC